MPERSHVAMTLCFFCGEGADILLATRYTHGGKPIDDLEPFDHKVLSTHPCSKCEALMKQGIYILSIKDGQFETIEAERQKWLKAKEDFDRERHFNKRFLPFVPNPYRTGVVTMVTEDCFRRISDGLGFDPALRDSIITKHRWTFMEDSVCELAGLYEHLEETGHKVHWRDDVRKRGLDPREEAIRLAEAASGKKKPANVAEAQPDSAG